MDFVAANKHVINNYTNFSGRAPRSEYWFAILGYMIVLILANIIDAVTGFPIFSWLLMLALFLPILAAAMRRLHDNDKSAWWILLGLVPVVGSIGLLVLLCLPGTVGTNRFGPDPLARL
jgi:uncharacterized membrane protein YhaH (DUF805 family)